MNRIKNFLYDTNDILVAIIILLVAALVITTRVDSIMTYPETAVSGGGSQVGHVRPMPDPGPDPAPTPTPEPEPDPEPDESNTDGEPDATDTVNYALHIAYGQSMNEIADNLIKLGLFEDRQDFSNHISRHNADLKVKAGDFVIPANSTKDEVIGIITGN